MKKNMTLTDRTLRIIIAVLIGVFYWQGMITGTLAIVLSAIALIFLITSLFNFCPLYRVFGIRRWESAGKSKT